MPRVIAFKAEAETALGFHRAFTATYPYNKKALPDGWKFVGSGATRFAYLSPSGIVYKVAESDYDVRCSEHEYRCIRSLRGTKMPEGYRLPTAALVRVKNRVVIAMEYIPHDADDRLISRAPKEFAIWDWSSNNCRMDDDGMFVPIDFGFASIETGINV